MFQTLLNWIYFRLLINYHIILFNNLLLLETTGPHSFKKLSWNEESWTHTNITNIMYLAINLWHFS